MNVALGKYFSFTVRLLNFSAGFLGQSQSGLAEEDHVPLSQEFIGIK